MKRITFLLLSLATIAWPSFAASMPTPAAYRMPTIFVVAKRAPKMASLPVMLVRVSRNQS